MSLLHRIANLFRRRKLYSEIDEELQFHIDARTDDALAEGLSPREARQDALRRFGGQALAAERARDADVAVCLESVGQDIRYAWRSLRRTPAVTLVALASLALAIGANTAIFSVVNAVVLRALPYQEPDRLAIVWSTSLLNGSQEINTSFPNIDDWKAHSQCFSAMAGYRYDTAPASVPQNASGEPEWTGYTWVYGDLFRLLGRTPLLGRAFTGGATEPAVAVLSYSLWKRRFAGSSAAIGQTIRIADAEFQVIGVMPEDFAFPSESQVWVPAAALPNFAKRHSQRDAGFGTVIARFAPSVTLASARAEMQVVASQLAQQYPKENGERGVSLIPLALQIHGATVPYMLMLLFGAVGFVLLIACANVANLLLARGAVRGREVALRTALGAGRLRITRQLLTESMFLAVAAGLLSVPLASWGIRSLIALAPPGIARLEEARLDPGVLAFSLGLSLVTGVLFGLAPALRISRYSAQRGTTSGPQSQSLRRALVVAEFALAVVLLTGAGLLLRSFVAMQGVDPGFDSQHIVSATLRFRNAIPKPQRAGLYRETLRRIGLLPGVQAAGAVNTIFYAGERGNFGLRAVEGRGDESRDQWTPMAWNTVAGDYFGAMGVPLLKGRLFTDRDAADAPPVVIINESMARRYWPGEDPIGRGIKGFDPRGRNDEWVRIIGVVKDMHSRGLDHAPMAQIYETQAQSADETQSLVVRSRVGMPLLREAVRSVDPTAVVSDVATLDQRLQEMQSPRRFQTLLLTLFAAIALVLAAAGIFGMMHYSVVQRTREIGVRMALGARPESVVGLVVREAATLVAAGLACGLAASFGLTRLIRSLLFGVSATDPVTLAGVAAVLAIIGLLACLLPARRASQVDPMLALRCE